MIRVLIVDDSDLFRAVFSAVIEQDPELSVVGEARDGHQAVDMVRRLRPDVITMDVNMPKMDGYAAVEQIMAYFPTPILIVTGSTGKQAEDAVMKALGLGALDVVAKPDLRSPQSAAAVGGLIEELKACSRAHVVTHVMGKRRKGLRTPTPEVARAGQWRAVAIAASTGGPAALAGLLSDLPPNLDAAIIVTQHMAVGFTQTFVRWLSTVSGLKVKEACGGERLEPGLVLVVPAARHMTVNRQGVVVFAEEAPATAYSPSGDLLLTSVAECFGRRAVGLVLTGMGTDGAEGMSAVQEHGGRTLAQDEATSAVFGMPKAAIEAGVVDRVLPLEDIAGEIVRIAGVRRAMGPGAAPGSGQGSPSA